MGNIFLVYCLRVPEGNEPLIALLGSEDQARGIENRLVRSGAAMRVSWEELPLRTSRSEVPDAIAEGTMVHVVSLGGLDEDGVHRGRVLEDDPIGLGAFESLDDARTFAAKQLKDHVRIRSLPTGWIDPGIDS
jgi:hypothetical protein